MRILTDYFFLLSVSAALGLLLGRVSWGRFRLGLSGALFCGIAAGILVPRLVQEGSSMEQLLAAGIVPKDVFYLFLILFVASVGLLASRDVGQALRQYGMKFFVLAVVITLAGAVTLYAIASLTGQNAFSVTGLYVGALTSSPGLGAALEAAASYGVAAEAAVGAGYALAYPFGVIAVIITMQLVGEYFKPAIQAELSSLQKRVKTPHQAANSFDILGFTLVCLTGVLIGKLRIPLGSIGSVSLGNTGGVLLAALGLGCCGSVGPVHFQMDAKALSAIREISLVFFLAAVGLRYSQSFYALNFASLYLVLAAVAAALVSLVVGIMIGRMVLKINWVLLLGAICGGMTSTPGLGAAIDAAGDDLAAAGYGAAYPVALFCMVIFTVGLLQLLA